MASKNKDLYSYYNHVTGVVKALENKSTLIDLRNESYVSGKIKNVDGFMNVDMENVVYRDNRGVDHYFESFFVSGRSIRYVHIPKGLSAEKLMNATLAGVNKKPQALKQQYNKGRSFKKFKAEKYNRQTVAQAYQIKKH